MNVAIARKPLMGSLWLDTVVRTGVEIGREPVSLLRTHAEGIHVLDDDTRALLSVLEGRVEYLNLEPTRLEYAQATPVQLGFDPSLGRQTTPALKARLAELGGTVCHPLVPLAAWREAPPSLFGRFLMFSVEAGGKQLVLEIKHEDGRQYLQGIEANEAMLWPSELPIIFQVAG